MAYTSEIEKLERRNAENPQGRLFAPLADAYRKQGELERAMTLLREGLDRHPDYIGAQIVLGRCHLDLGEDSEASGAFQRVLDLDGENVIALKALADLAERGGRRDEAVSRLERLLEIDRGNEEAAAQLEALRARRDAAPVEPAGPAAFAEPEPDDAPMAPPAGIELTSGFGPEGIDFGTEAGAPPVSDLQLMDVAADADDVEPLEGLEVPELGGEEFFLERETDIQLEGSAENEFQSRSDAERLAAPEAAAPNPWQDLAAETVPAAGAEPPASWVEEDEAEAEAGAAAEAPELVELEGEAGEPEEDFAAVEPPTFEELGEVTAAEPVAEDVVAAGEPELVVTETMAAVYERQGLRHEALTIYRELAARRPDDSRLAAKVAELQAAAPPAPVPAPAPMQAAEPPSRPAAGYAAAETGRQSLGAFLRGVLGAHLAGPGATAAPAGRQELAEAGMDAAPTRPAADPVSLSAVFGDDLPPAAPAASQSAPSAGQGFSFDAFFGAGSAPAREGARASAAGEDDLEQFHAWLQGLKK
jgi:tetratricopeptide (TPR) repeat protein